MSRRLSWRALAIVAAGGAAVVGAAEVWVRLRPLVKATGGPQGVYYTDDTHRAVFGSDAVFMTITSALALVVAVAVVLRGRNLLRFSQILAGAGAAFAGSVLTAWLGALLDGVSRGPLQDFPPTQLEQGQTVIEPARLHTPAALGAAAICWLLVVFISALLSRRQAPPEHLHR